MSIATDILNAVAEEHKALFPETPVATRRATDAHPIITPGDKIPRFVIEGNEAENVEPATALSVFAKYRVRSLYITREVPGTKGENTDIRDRREVIRKRLYGISLPGVATVNDVNVYPGRPYDLPLNRDQTVSASPLVIVVETKEPAK